MPKRYEKRDVPYGVVPETRIGKKEEPKGRVNLHLVRNTGNPAETVHSHHTDVDGELIFAETFVDKLQPGVRIETKIFSVVENIPDTENKSRMYIVDKKLGKGGMGTVFLARREIHMPSLKHEDSADDEILYGKEVVIKIISPDMLSNPLAEKRFLREMQTQLATGDINQYVINVEEFVKIIDPDTREEHIGIVMQYMEDGDLRHMLDHINIHKETEKIDVNVIGTLFQQMALALKSMHENGLAHRDIKPENVMVDLKHGYIKLADFGLAKAVDVATEDSANNGTSKKQESISQENMKIIGRLTQEGTISGTPEYMSPELLAGSDNFMEGDLYALGVMLFDMRTGGHMPYEYIKNTDLYNYWMKKIEKNVSVADFFGSNYEYQVFDPIIETLIKSNSLERRNVVVEGETYNISTAQDLLETIEMLIKRFKLSMPSNQFAFVRDMREQEQILNAGYLGDFRNDDTISSSVFDIGE